jgi:hypothetical protein
MSLAVFLAASTPTGICIEGCGRSGWATPLALVGLFLAIGILLSLVNLLTRRRNSSN